DPQGPSGGQRRRVSFARALAAQPSVLLADEPVSMLDVSIRLEMLNLLDDLRKRLALALLYITHDIASARYFADEVLVMYAGEIVERGPAEDVTQQPAHPYTQLLVASAPDPDNLASVLRTRRPAPGQPGRRAPDRPPRRLGQRRASLLQRHRPRPRREQRPGGVRLPVQHQMPARGRQVPPGEPGTAADHGGPRGRLLAARRGR